MMVTEAGLPAPVKGTDTTMIDLNELLVHNPPATFYMRMQGCKLFRRGILPEDLLVVDRSRPPVPGCLVVFRNEGEFACRELIRDRGTFLLSDGSGENIPIDGDTEIFGTVTGVVRKL
jgi:DNA polymerase V